MPFFINNLIIFLISLIGITFNLRNTLIILLGLEIILLSLNLNFIFSSIYLDDLYGQYFSLLILTIAAAESAIGLAIIIVYYRIRNNISINIEYIFKK
jgi:NADH-quinone oxidoreductase subunit K